ncbi:MAG: hypothetical protein GWM90_06755, partial [Gemmatimonadetes bacterium]|nr:hypothetical protein [Gemmatimonadota bacterium]NIQ53491.1 hypothetical protein [Gemmatimonadota bacterium]NIU73633.1 hypothetical protein [Gammaproteobacteria bacterium]NIX43817.1 hypothetical protein [Gemmatimonadota bacterium]NIY08018.1 hypothetical protein [Gemmatimonadota bacterium]
FDLHRGTNQRLTFEGENHHDPVWSPDGQRLAFAAEREDGRGGTDIYVKHVDGRSPAQWVAGFEGFQYPADWLEDGTITLFSRVGLGAQTDIYMARVGSDADAVPLLTADWNEAAPRVSPGGRLLAYISEETGEPQVFLREFPDMRGRWQISAAPALSPLVWSRDGSAVFYRDRDTGRLLRAQLELEPTFRVVNRVELADRVIGVPRDLHPDGQRLLLTRQLGAVAIEEAEPDLVVVTNWFNELRRRLGQEPR